jgi:hypothetical protein
MDSQTLREWVIRFNEQGPNGLINVRSPGVPRTAVEVWSQYEMRVGQRNKLTYRWARKGSRSRAIYDQRTQSTYVFGAVCPEHGTGAALGLPTCNTELIQLHLDEIRARRWARST